MLVRKISDRVAFLPLTRHTVRVSKKNELIRSALNQKGIVVTDGIPEHIQMVLRSNGYKIKKRKKRNKCT